MKMQIDARRKGSTFILVSTEGNAEEREWLKSKEWNAVLMSVVCRDNAKDCFLFPEVSMRAMLFHIDLFDCVHHNAMNKLRRGRERWEGDRNENEHEIRGIISHVNRRTGKESEDGRRSKMRDKQVQRWVVFDEVWSMWWCWGKLAMLC